MRLLVLMLRGKLNFGNFLSCFCNLSFIFQYDLSPSHGGFRWSIRRDAGLDMPIGDKVIGVGGVGHTEDCESNHDVVSRAGVLGVDGISGNLSISSARVYECIGLVGLGVFKVRRLLLLVEAPLRFWLALSVF